ncbi:MAG: immune inhibitor A, partial [Candidatus Cloacimonadaceae bacterium]|nr:immune inhibitor A [Candidatus Cloacimonadaceae bacterium]
LGTTTVTDPLGQDAYGYFIFDDGDTGYIQCPVYNWIGIAPEEGGSGTALNITDPGATNDEGDQVGAISLQTVNLPFPFKFYGRNYHQITVSSNGFIAMGVTQNSDWRNWRLPGPGGPNPMIAVFWDDLQKNTGSNIYVYHNAAEHYYVVEWYNMISGYDRITPQTFQAILYDPVYYPTQTGDGQIKMQYKIFNNIDEGSGDAHPHGNYATIGIKDHNGTVGLEYTFNNQYPTAAKPLHHESALFITTKPFLSITPHLYVDQVNIFDNNENGYLEPGETANIAVRLGNMGMSEASNIAATISITDPYISVTNNSTTYENIGSLGFGYAQSFMTVNIAPNCPSNYSANAQINITSANGSWSYNIPLNVYKPSVVIDSWTLDDSDGSGNGSLDPGETAHIVFNYLNETAVNAYNVVITFTENSPYITLGRTTITVDEIPAGLLYQARISISATAAAPVGSSIPINYTITSQNAEPTSGQFSISIGITDILYDFEADNGGFTATSNQTFGWEWGISTYSGAYSGTKVWGTVLNASYENNATYELVSPSTLVGSGSQLTFRHRYNIENNYDGGQVLISTNNGASWTTITPTGGYPHQSLPALGGPGYHGTQTTWTLATFNLGSFSGQTIRIKWLFKTDGSVIREGWFIDDVMFTGVTGAQVSGKVAGTLSIDGVVSGNPNAYILAGDYVVKPEANGTYQINLPAGQYTVSALLEGHTSTSIPVTITDNNVVNNINPQLNHLSIPSGVSWKVVGNQLSIRWTPINNPNLSAYRVYEKKGTQGWVISETLSANTITKTVETNTWYDFKVVALYTDNESLHERLVSIDFLNPENDVK